jgi:hypothetical protein
MAANAVPRAPVLKQAGRDPAQGLPDLAARLSLGRKRSAAVIPGRALFGANPESSQGINLWIPGPREDACPGMTEQNGRGGATQGSNAR